MQEAMEVEAKVFVTGKKKKKKNLATFYLYKNYINIQKHKINK
jgi:hypothetical protein